jgi:hypothetical protein
MYKLDVSSMLSNTAPQIENLRLRTIYSRVSNTKPSARAHSIKYVHK